MPKFPRYILKKDITFPAGTILDVAPTTTVRHGEGHAEALLPIGKDAIAHLNVCFDPGDVKMAELVERLPD